jgi:BlaI family penicillinase repressor
MAEYTPRISDAEWAVMEELWKEHPLTALDVVKRLTPRFAWQDQTIRTMLRRLVDKGAVDYQADGKIYYYQPAVSRAQCVRVESRSFLERVFGGSPKPLLVQMVNEAELTPEDIAELKKLLEKKGKK